VCDLETSRMGAPYIYDISHLRVKPFMTQNTLKLVYHSYFHSLTNYGLTFWRNSSYSNSTFKLQKRIIRIIVGIGMKDSCRVQNIKYFTIEITIYIYFPLYSLWLKIKINLGLILRYIV